MKHLTRADRDEFEKQLEEVWKPELEKCKLIDDFDEKIACMSEVVHGLTAAQDLANLTVRGVFFKNDPQASKDSRWEAVHLLDDANAVSLGVTNAKYDPEYFMKWGYVEEKADSFRRRWQRIWSNDITKTLEARTDEDRAKAVKEMDEKEPDWRKYI